MANQTGKKGDVEFVISGDDNVTQIFKGIITELQGIRNQTRNTGREVTSSMDQMGDTTRRAGNEMETVSDRLRKIGDGTTHIKRVNQELEQTDDKARAAGREMERGFRDGGRAADQAASRINLLKQRVNDVSREMRGMFDTINQGTAGFHSFVGDQIRRGVYVGGLAVTGFAAHSVKRGIDKEYEFSKLGSVLKSSYYDNGTFDEAAYNKDFAELQAFIKKEGLRPDREADTMGLIGIANELAKNNMDPKQVMAALSTVSDFSQATELDPDTAAKYLANKAEAAKMEYTPETFQKLADQFVQTIDMSSLDSKDLLYAERYTDFANAMGGIDYAVTQAMQVALSKISVEGEKGGTALRTLFLESTKLSAPDSALDNASSTALAKKVEKLLAEFNSINLAVEKDTSVSSADKGTEKIMRKTALLNKYYSAMTSDEQMEVSSILFGKEAASVGTIFAGDDYKEFLGYIDAIRDSSGITKRYADDRSNTDKGQLVALGKSIEAIQDKVGRSLNPLFDATISQMNKLATEGKFSFDEISKGVEQSADELSKELNPEIAEAFKGLSNLALNGFEVGVSLTPLASGAGKALINLLNGDISGATNEIVLALEATDLRIENLPGELQGLANAAKNAAIFLAAMVAIDKGVTIVENGKKIWDAGQKVGETIRNTKQSGESPTFDDNRTIKANIVNVYGGQVNGSGSNKSGGGGPTPVPVGTGSKPNTGNAPDKTTGKWNTGWGQGIGWGGTTLLLGSMLGLTDELSEEVQSAIDAFGWGALLNNFLGNPLGTLKVGSGAALGGATAVGSTWMWGLSEYSDYVNENQRNNFYNKYGPVGADKWLFANGNNELEPASTPKGYVSGAYIKETSAVIDFLMSKKGTKFAPHLQSFSDDLLSEAKSNAAKNAKFLLTGYDGGDIETFLQKRLNEYYSLNNANDYRSLDVEKKYTRAAGVKRAEERSRDQERRDRIQYLREIENDPFINSAYKKQMFDEITRPVSSSTNNAPMLIPALMDHLSKMQQSPIEVKSENNLRVTVEDNRAVQVQMENISNYAERTLNNRTLTPMRAAKMKRLE